MGFSSTWSCLGDSWPGPIRHGARTGAAPADAHLSHSRAGIATSTESALPPPRAGEGGEGEVADTCASGAPSLPSPASGGGYGGAVQAGVGSAVPNLRMPGFRLGLLLLGVALGDRPGERA